MGLIRKTISASTIGMVDYRSDKERIARSTRKTAHAAQASAKAQQSLARTVAKQAKHERKIDRAVGQQLPDSFYAQPQPAQQQVNPPAGWYPDASDPRLTRWWDGLNWTSHTQAAPPPSPWSSQ